MQSKNKTECEVMKEALVEITRIVTNDRNKYYGTPSENHSVTGEMWGSFLSRKLGFRVEISGSDVCWMNLLQKASREAHWSKRDNAIDAAGYAANAIACKHRESLDANSQQSSAVQNDNSGDIPRLPAETSEQTVRQMAERDNFQSNDIHVSDFPLRDKRVSPEASETDRLPDSKVCCQRVSEQQGNNSPCRSSSGEDTESRESFPSEPADVIQSWEVTSARWPSKRPHQLQV